MEALGLIAAIVMIIYIVFQLCDLTAGLFDLFINPDDKNHKS